MSCYYMQGTCQLFSVSSYINSHNSTTIYTLHACLFYLIILTVEINKMNRLSSSALSNMVATTHMWP